MKQYTVLDGFNIVLAMTIFIIPFIFNYDTNWIIFNVALGISVLNNVFITNKKVKIFIAVACLSAFLYSYFLIK